MTLYRMYLGGKRGSKVIPASEIEAYFETFLDKMLEGYSRVKTVGVWRGVPELVEFLGEKQDLGRVREAAHVYAQKFGQDAVLVTHTEVSGAEFITAEPLAA